MSLDGRFPSRWRFESGKEVGFEVPFHSVLWLLVGYADLCFGAPSFLFV